MTAAVISSLVAADYAQPSFQCGMSSLYRRSDPRFPSNSAVQVRTTRLDTFLTHKCPAGARFALWIDAEGKAYEVIEGAAE
jgi:hypothetical protein